MKALLETSAPEPGKLHAGKGKIATFPPYRPELFTQQSGSERERKVAGF
jgi:hypothetical protein